MLFMYISSLELHVQFMSSALQLRKLRLREVKWLAWGHTQLKLNINLMTSNPMFFLPNNAILWFLSLATVCYSYLWKRLIWCVTLCCPCSLWPLDPIAQSIAYNKPSVNVWKADDESGRCWWMHLPSTVPGT